MTQGDSAPEAPGASASAAAPTAPMAPLSRDNRPEIVGGDAPEPPYPIELFGTVTKGFGRGARFLGIPTANLPDSSLGPLNDLGLTGIYYGFARVHPTFSTPLPTAAPTPALTPSPSSARLAEQAAAGAAAAHGHAHPSVPKSVFKAPLTSEQIAQLPPQTAPYPPDSVPDAPAAPKRLADEDGKVWPMVMSVGWNPYFKNEKITAEVHIMHPFAHDFYGHEMSVLILGYIRPELDYVSKEALIQDIQTDVKVALNSLSRPAYATQATAAFLTQGPSRN
ncbi:riboflavin kinase [Vanrija albida]|uniref:Riboflavin kinase n=1 Tax=Vanrija albida TaxID=181172 RepID=A0ABR3PRV3_9TREE